jgi:hypothetical protein
MNSNEPPAPAPLSRHSVCPTCEGDGMAKQWIARWERNRTTFWFELTDTLDEVANYAWVKEQRIDLLNDVSYRSIVSFAKAWAGLTGKRCEVSSGVSVDGNNFIEIRPYGICVVLFVTWVEYDDE